MSDTIDRKAPMSIDQFADYLSKCHERELALCKAGQAEYAHDPSNTFANFERVAAQLGNVTREDVLLVYALKHLDGIVAHVQGHKLQRENIQGRIDDLRLYLALLGGMFESDD